ncbi:MAG: M23 family metallopeptidase [Acidimicrobiia bacterium]
MAPLVPMGECMDRAWLWLIMLALMAVPGPAWAAEGELYPMYFPVIGENSFTDSFGEPRGDHLHQGIDIMADKMTPVVAVADGTVGWMHDEQGGNCCDLALVHDDGWESWYVHLNNDTPGTDDGQGWGFADGIAPGVWVAAGTLIAWVGDSGNAEWTSPHLHFELHQPDGTVVNPYESLLTATVLEQPLEWAGLPFSDIGDSVHADDIVVIAERGITKGCNPPLNTLYCPSREVTRGEIAAFVRRTLESPFVEEDFFGDDGASVFQDDINALAALGIALECGEGLYCPERDLTRAEMAVFVARGLALPAGPDAFGDDQGHAFEAEINALAAAGIVRGCNPPDNTLYCPERTLSRAEMATFLVRALALLEG